MLPDMNQLHVRDPRPRQQIATRVAFFIAGFAMSAWAPLVPFAKSRLGVNDGVLGGLLLCLGIGSIVAMPWSGYMASRFGCRRVIVASASLMGLMLPFLAELGSVPGFMAALLLFGAGLGALDVTINIQAIRVERESGRTMMSGFHGLFSVGGFAGAVTVTTLLGAGMSTLTAVLVVDTGIAALLAIAFRDMLAQGARQDGPNFARPRGVVLMLGILCLIAFLTEGAVLDWSALFLTQSGALDASQGGFGYAAFSCAMTFCRLSGDAWVHRFGGRAIVVSGALVAAMGLVLATQVAGWPWALGGFALVGVGCANIAPVLFTAAGRQTDMPVSLAVPAITSLGYAGILAGPAAIGVLAEGVGLGSALMAVAVLLVGVAFVGPRLPG
jgi:predicted MFS family arabinose efflux permease